MPRICDGAVRRAGSAMLLAGALLPAGLAAVASTASATAARPAAEPSTASQIQLLRNAPYANGIHFTESNPTLTKNYAVVLHDKVGHGPYGDRFTMVGRPAVSADVYGAPGALVVLRDKRPAGSPPSNMYQLWLFRVVDGQVRWVADGVALDQKTNSLNERSAVSATPVVLRNHNAAFDWRLASTRRHRAATYRTRFTLQHDGTGSDYLLDAGSKVVRH